GLTPIQRGSADSFCKVRATTALHVKPHPVFAVGRSPPLSRLARTPAHSPHGRGRTSRETKRCILLPWNGRGRQGKRDWPSASLPQGLEGLSRRLAEGRGGV